MLRQPVRTAIFVLLMLAASFTFVMRVVEYIVITEKIENIGGFYRSVGVLQYTGAASIHVPVNVFAGAEIVHNSPFVDFDDRRRGVSGVLRDMKNADIDGMRVSFPASVRAQPTDEIYTIGMRHTDIFFYGELISKNFSDDYGFPMGFMIGSVPPNIELIFRMDYVLSGYAEHWKQGRGEDIILIRYMLPAPRAHYAEYDEIMPGKPAIANMEIGQRYFLRAGFYTPWLHAHFDMPRLQAGENNELLVIESLNTDFSIRRRTLPDSPIWYLPVGVDEVVDFASTPGLENIPDMIERLHHNQREIYLRTTTDMTALPALQTQTPSLELVEGRWIDREDYLNANPVAAIHSSFARIRNLELGDTIVIDIPKEQIVIGVSPRTVGDDFDIVTTPGEYLTYELELTIVGMFRDADPALVFSFPFLMDNHIYIPDSVLPDDFVFSAALTDDSMWTAFDAVMEDKRSMSDFAAAMFPPGPGSAPYWPLPAIEAVGHPDFIPNIWYSFVLNDPRDESAFLFEHRDALSALGFNVIFLGQDAEAFWSSAEQILRAMTFNAVMFCIVLVLVLALVVFLYLRQRRKEFAVMRALGVPVKKVYTQIIASAMLCGIPAVIIGGVGGWFFHLTGLQIPSIHSAKL